MNQDLQVMGFKFSIYWILLFKIFLLPIHSFSQKELNEFDDIELYKSNLNNIDVNFQAGLTNQDVKRSVVYILVVDNDGNAKRGGSGFLINTTLNSYTSNTNTPTFYIITSEHVLTDLENEAEIYISFDFEKSNSSTVQPDWNDYLRKLYKVPIEKVVFDKNADIVLFKIKTEFINSLNLNSTDEMNGGFYNAYAAGWNLNPTLSLLMTNISHPLFDLKKLFITPSTLDTYYTRLKYSKEDNSQFQTRYLKSFLVEGGWNENSSSPQPGSSGSPLIDEGKNAVALASCIGCINKTNDFISLSNSWLYKPNWDTSNGGISGNVGLIDYLDPMQTWINKVPGGYIKDLLPVSNADFYLSLAQNQVYAKEKTFSLQYYLQHLENLDDLSVENILGIKLDKEANSAPVYLSVEDSKSGNLFYGAFANNSRTNNTTIFENKDWTDSNWPSHYDKLLDNFYQNVGIRTDEFKYRMINAKLEEIKSRKRKFSDAEASLKNNNNLDCIVKLSRNLDGIPEQTKVMAIGLPNNIPINAKEFYIPNSYDNLWKSKKYTQSKGHSNPNELYINKIKLSQATFENEISTGHNGGYLNLINPFYESTFDASSVINTKKLKFEIQVNQISNKYYYKAWIDYYNDVDINNFYNFVSDPIPHPIELIAEGSSSNNNIEFTIDLPSYFELGIEEGAFKPFRFRIAVSSQDNLAQNGEYEQGEVEDYLLVLEAPSRNDLLKEQAAILLSIFDQEQIGENGESCEAPDQEPAPVPNPITINVDDSSTNAGYQCNDFVCAETNCKLAALNTNAIEGNYSICITGENDYIALDRDNTLLNNSFTARTISFWLNNADDTGIEELYDDGGSAEGGMGIRLNNTTGQIELGVRSGLTIQSINATIPNVATGTWIQVVGVFDNGKLSLYQNGTLSAEQENVGFSTIPAHQDPSAFGGTNGTNIFNSNDKSYHGCADEIMIFDQALSLEDVQTLYTARSTSATTRINMGEEKATTQEKPAQDTELVIFPNPTKGEVSIIVELKQTSDLTIKINDLTGKEVFTKQYNQVGEGHRLIQLGNLNLETGVYVVKVATNTGEKTGKLVVE